MRRIDKAKTGRLCPIPPDAKVWMQRPQDSPDTRRQTAVSENPLGQAPPAPPRIAKSHVVGNFWVSAGAIHLASALSSTLMPWASSSKIASASWPGCLRARRHQGAPARGHRGRQEGRQNTPAASSASIQPGLASSPAIARHLGCDPRTVQRTLRAPIPGAGERVNGRSPGTKRGRKATLRQRKAFELPLPIR